MLLSGGGFKGNRRDQRGSELSEQSEGSEGGGIGWGSGCQVWRMMRVVMRPELMPRWRAEK